MDDDQATRILLVDNKASDHARYLDDKLVQLLEGLGGQLDGTGYAPDDIAGMLDRLNAPAPDTRAPLPPSVALADRFLVPPFSVLDARQGYWQDRKNRWDSVGLRSGAGRARGLVYGGARTYGLAEADPVTALIASKGRGSRKAGPAGHGDPVTDQIADMTGGTSLFDPVLAEVLLAWLSKPGARIIDPFAGGSVRGVVSSLLGRQYTGVDLSDDQCQANREQALELCAGASLLGGVCPTPQWHVGDSRDITATWPAADGLFDMLLTCPPYFDLEVYSDDPRDLSRATGGVDGFTQALAACLTPAVARMHDDRFAAIVMGEARDRNGDLDGLVPATIEAARQAGLRYYNEAILVTPVGTNAIRAARPFMATRKIVRGHQTVLIFVRGSAARAAQWLGPVDVADIPTGPAQGFLPEAP